MHMSTPVSPEVRSEILASIKSGTSIVEAAVLHNVTASTVRKWMKKLGGIGVPTTSEIQRLKKRIEFLENVILDLVLEQKALTYKG